MAYTGAAHATEHGRLQAWTSGNKPDFTLQVSSGGDFALAAQRGRPVIVHFFATWCDPCRDELPALQRFVARAGNPIIVAISVAEVDDRVRRFLDKYQVSLPVALDRDRAVAKAWDVSILPTTFILDRQLRPRLYAETDVAWDDVKPDILQSLTTSDVSASAPTRTSTLQFTNPKEDQK